MSAEMLLAIVVAVIGGLFGGGGILLWLLERRAKVKDKKEEKQEKTEEKEDAIKMTLRSLLLIEMRQIAREHIRNKYIPFGEFDFFLELHTNAKNLKVNGSMDDLLTKIKLLDVIDPTEEKTPRPKCAERPLVLTVDDSTFELRIIQNSLQDEYRVDVLSKPNEVERYLTRRTPDIILLDYLMPELTGLDLIPIIRSYPEHHSTPIIMLTGDDTQELKKTAIELGANAFMVKPFTDNILKEILAKYVKC